MKYKFTDEWLDLVDENDQVIDKMLRSEVMKKDLHNFRAVVGFVKNSKGQLWIPRRVKEKIIYPLALDMSVAGHVSSGEKYDEAFEREAREEIGFNGAYTFLGKLTPQDGTCCFDHVYEIASDDEPKYSSFDFCEAFWLYPEEIISKINAGEACKSDLAFLVRYFYF